MNREKLSKKSIINIIVCLVLAVLLVLSLTLTVSGAWFTDSSSAATQSPVNLRFGTVTAGNVNVATGITTLKPGETIAYSGTGSSSNIQYGGNVDAYYRLSFSATNGFGSYLSFSPAVSGQFQDSNYIYGKDLANGTIPKGTVKFADTALNSLQGQTFALTVKVELIQAANIGNAAVSGTGTMSTLENYQALFGAIAVQ